MPAGPDLVVARLSPDDGVVDAVAMNDGRDGVEERERSFAGERADRGAQAWRGQRPRRDNDAAPVGGRQAVDFARERRSTSGLRLSALRDRVGERVAIDGERAAGRQLRPVAGRHDERAGAAHLLMQQPDGVVLPIVGAERVRADELGAAAGLVRVRHARGAHFVQHDGNAGARDLTRGFGARKAGADDVNGSDRHGRCLAHRRTSATPVEERPAPTTPSRNRTAASG